MTPEDHEKQLISQNESMERTSVLANERTYAAWIRTGLTTFAASIAVDKLLVDSIPELPLRMIALGLGFASCLFFILAAVRYHHVEVRLVSSKVSGAHRYLLNFISILLVLLTATTILALIS